jgi:hypothetical protein
MTHIVMPSTPTEQGHAFEDLILSYYQKSGCYTVREWSGYLHGASGKWWQCDGIVEDSRGSYLVEAKFFCDRPATVRDINPARRQTAAQDMGCTGLLYISLNGFATDMLGWPHSAKLDVRFLTWPDVRADLLSGLSKHASVLLDEFDLTATQATATQSTAELHFDTITSVPLSPQFPEFVTVPDSLELWLRRMPRFPLQLAQIAAGQFWYETITKRVTLIPDCVSDLSLQEAWAIQDAISGYANRAYSAVRDTAQVLASLGDGLIADVQASLGTLGWETGPDGIRRSLDFLARLGMARKWLDQGKARYSLSPLGRAYAIGGPDDNLFADVLKMWLPYQAVCKAIVKCGVSVTANDILNYFKVQYKPYEPYAHSLFNPNKAEGLVRLYKLFGS